MPVVLRRNQDLELNLVEYSGSISIAELQAIALFLANEPGLLRSDTLTVVRPGARFDIEFETLDRLFQRYANLYAAMSFQIVRRSAWICQSPAAQHHVDYWLGPAGDAREAMSTTLRQFGSFAEAGDWLVLNEAEIMTLESGAGFDDIAYFADAETVRAAAR